MKESADVVRVDGDGGAEKIGGQHLRRLRLQKAMGQLLQSDLSVTAISAEAFSGVGRINCNLAEISIIKK